MNTRRTLTALLGFVLLAAQAAQAQFTYTTNDGAITLVRYTGKGGAVVISNFVTSIGGAEPFAFSGVTSVTIPANVTNIVEYAFFQALSLTNITVAAKNSFYSSAHGVLFNKSQTTLIQFPEGSGGSYTIPNSVTNIGGLAMADCPSLANVIIPGSVPAIGVGAFSADTSLTNVTIPGSLTNIGDGVFGGCSSLTNITVVPENSFYSSTNGVLFNKSLTTLIQFPGGLAGSYTIPNSVTSIETYAFENCTSLATVIIPDSVTSIGDGAFSGSGLASVTIPDSVTSIETNAFYFCTSLASVTIGDRVTNIGDSAFNFCTSLASVVIPDSVTSIGDGVFGGCARLTNITVVAENSSYSSTNGVLFNKSLTTLIQFPSGLGGNYAIPNSVTSIETNAFEDCTSLANVIIPDSVASIGDGAFYFCTSLAKVTIGNGVTTIGNEAFNFCTSLASVIIPDSVTSIGDSAFAYCQGLTNVCFEGNAPTNNTNDESVFSSSPSEAPLAVIYYVSGTTGWGSTFDGIATAPCAQCAGTAGNYTIAVSASPSTGGTASGGGPFASGSLQTVTATTNNGYTFVDWTENGIVVSSNASYTFNLSNNVILVANFTSNAVNYMIAASASPSAGGTVSGGGFFAAGSSQTVTATTNNGYTFVNWTDNRAVVSSNASYTFTLSNDVTLVANFTVNAVNYMIAASASPSAGGTVSGGGNFPANTPEGVIAQASSGYRFINWTENGAVVSSSPNYYFTLNTNLTLVANFVLKGDPKLAITSPTAGQSVTGSNVAFTVTGTTTDKAAVTNVAYQFNGGSWVSATPGHSWSNWTASITLNPGANTLSAYAQDISGSISPTEMVKFKFFPSDTLVVAVPEGENGNFTPADNGKLLELGTNYTLTAVPGHNWIFSNWVAGGSANFVSNNPVLTFKMRSNMVLTASFVTNFFLSAQGAYNGLFAPTNGPRKQTNSGSFTLNVLTGGSFSGDLYLGSATPIALSGKFGPNGTAVVTNKRTGLNTLTTTLTLDLADQSVEGMVSDGSFDAPLLGYQNVFTSENKAPYAGQYTLVIPGTTNAEVGPFGASYGTVTVLPSGVLAFAGGLADGTTVSRSSAVSKDGAWPFYLPLYNGHGSIYSWNYFTSNVNNGAITFATNASWINLTNASKGALYQGGFANANMLVLGSTYMAAAPALDLPGGQGEVQLEGGNLASNITTLFTLSSNNKITVTNAMTSNDLVLTITKSSGLISGSFTNATNPKVIFKVNGVLFQSQTNAQGYFLGTNESGAFRLENP